MKSIVLRDLRVAVRAGGGFGLALGFFLIVVALVPLGVGPDIGFLARIAPGILWVGALLAALLSLDRIFATDWEDGSLELLVTAPLPTEGIVLAKSIAHWLTTGLPLAVAAPVFGVLLNLPWPGHIWLFVGLLVGTPALSVIGAFGAALTVGLRRGGLLLSLLVLPLYVPTLVFGAEVARRGAEGAAVSTPMAILVAISLGATALLPFAGAFALRMNLR